MFTKLSSIIAVLCFLILSQNTFAQTVINYKESTANIKNPERGLYLYGSDSLDHSNGCWWNSPAKFENFKNRLDDPNSKQMSLVYLQYDLGEFRQNDKELKKLESYFKCVQQDFEVLESRGFKAILRFGFNPRKRLINNGEDSQYYDNYGENNTALNPCGKEPEANKCEESIERIVGTYLNNKIFTDFIKNNAHLMSVWQAGFLGKYGEWYYTAEEAGIMNDSKMSARVKVLKKMLEILPKPIFVQVRTPYYKEYAIKNLPNKTDDDKAVIEDFKNRIGIYDDALFDDKDYFQTFGNYGTHNENEDFTFWKDYLSVTDKKVAVGGEIPDDHIRITVPKKDEQKQQIFDEFGKYHLSFFNEDKLKKNGSINWSGLRKEPKQLEKSLGYRILLSQASYKGKIKAGDKLTIDLTLMNVGWAFPFYKRPLEVFLCAEKDSDCKNKRLAMEQNIDITNWTPSTLKNPIPIKITVDIPTADLKQGKYEIYLNLPDSNSKLINNSAYSIQLANALDSNFRWVETKGYNRFGSVSIE